MRRPPPDDQTDNLRPGAVNILLDAPWLDRSGAPLALLRLARHLAPRHRVDLVPSRNGDRTLVPEFAAAGVRVLDRTAVPGDYDLLLALSVFRVQLLSRMVDRMPTLLWVLEPALGRRIVTENPLVADAFRAAGRIVFVAGSQPAAVYRDYLPRDNWEVVELGIPLSPAPPPRPPRRPGRLELVQVSTLESRKGQHVSLDALARLDDPAIRLALVGDGTRHPRYVEELRQLLAAWPGFADRVTFAGAVTPADALARYGAADAALFPTLDDNIPTALIEAMGEGCPVIASALPPIAEAVEDGVSGLLVPPGDPAALAAAIARLRDEPGLAERLAAAGAARVRARYDLATHLARMDAALARTVEEWRSRRAPP